MSKEFNVTGKCISSQHYMADVSAKMTEILKLVEKGHYFIINRPRQYGKTTTLYELSAALRKRGDYIVFNVSFEGIGNDAFKSEKKFSKTFVEILVNYATYQVADLGDWLQERAGKINDLNALSQLISQLCKRIPQKIAVLIDEVDQSSNNDIFIKFLAMLRNKFLSRDEIPTFHSVVLAGVHDVKSLKLKIRPDSEQKYNSPWNIAADFKVDMNLHPSEIKSMLADYVHERGVVMDVETMSYGLFYYTSGYPFLVSRLCKIMDEDLLPLKTTQDWTQKDLEWAVKRLVHESNTNFETQIKNLENNPDLYETVYQIAIEGESRTFNIHNPVTNLGVIYGLLINKEGRLAVHNRIYNELIINYMSTKMEYSQWAKRLDFGEGYRNDDRTLNLEAVLKGFQSFMKREYNAKERDFLEKNGRLVFLAFLKPIINGAGYDFKEPQISEEKRLDIAITYYEYKYIVELKIWRGQKSHEKGLLQLANYLESQQLAEGYLLIFDHAKIKNWATDEITVLNKRIFMVWV
jgi:AAA-like domain/PD-(D/E)XK nuclease superfamily